MSCRTVIMGLWSACDKSLVRQLQSALVPQPYILNRAQHDGFLTLYSASLSNEHKGSMPAYVHRLGTFCYARPSDMFYNVAFVHWSYNIPVTQCKINEPIEPRRSHCLHDHNGGPQRWSLVSPDGLCSFDNSDHRSLSCTLRGRRYITTGKIQYS